MPQAVAFELADCLLPVTLALLLKCLGGSSKCCCSSALFGKKGGGSSCCLLGTAGSCCCLLPLQVSRRLHKKKGGMSGMRIT